MHDVHVELQTILSEVSDANKSVAGSLCDVQENIELLKPFREYILPSEYKAHLSQVYKAMYTNVSVVASFCIRSGEDVIHGTYFVINSSKKQKWNLCSSSYSSTWQSATHGHC